MTLSMQAVAFTNILAPYDLPCFTLPFASLLSLLFLGTRTYTSFDIVDSLTTPRLPLDVRSDLIIEFDIIWRGVINGIAQIYFMESIVGGLLVCLAELIASWKGAYFIQTQFVVFPLPQPAADEVDWVGYATPVFVFSVIGSALGVLVGYLLGVPTAEIRSGLWGFNPSLSAMALFPVFMTSNWQSALLSIHSAIATIFVYAPPSRLRNRTSFLTPFSGL
jgi:urea transporter